jgi:OmcA/MtrC family decaheme c-type cytochrome
MHQDIYRDYKDAETKSQYKLVFADVDDAGDPTDNGLPLTSVPSPTTAGTFLVTLEFKLTKNGLPYGLPTVNDPGLVSLNQKRFIVQGYYAGDVYPYKESRTLRLSTITDLGNGNWQVTQDGVTWNPLDAATAPGLQAYGYIAGGALNVEGMTLYSDVSDNGWAYGTAVEGSGTEYESVANVEGCEACHGAPYLKHGYRAAVVEGLTDFAACKECHYDDGAGGHLDWQQMVDEPYEWATGVEPDAVRYAYKRSVMQDTHQTHAMEFPYPMSMANCSTCHRTPENLAAVLADENFTIDTCKSCHAVEGTDAWEGQKYYQQAGDGGRARAPALRELWAAANVDWHTPDADCQDCHVAPNAFPKLADYHNGYDKQIYDASGQRYADLNSVSIGPVSFADNKLDIRITSANTQIVPELLVSFYGYDAKHMLVSSHTRDAGAANCGTSTCRYEINIDGNPVSQANRLFIVEADSQPGAWHVKADLAAYVQPSSTGLVDIPTLITDGKIKRAEIVVLPELLVGDTQVALNAASQTVELPSGGLVDDYFKGANAVVEVAKCNACHDALGTTFHSASYGSEIVACRSCHVPTSGGSHLEMQSRGIDSYIHAIHKFQAFDIGDIDFTDPVEAARYDLHVGHVFPNFTIKNCEACHTTSGDDAPVTYDVPDQSESFAGLESASDTVNVPRNIGGVPQYVVGPANRACGGCHRAALITADDASGLFAFNAHTDMGGYTIENPPVTAEEPVAYVYQMIEKILSFFD